MIALFLLIAAGDAYAQDANPGNESRRTGYPVQFGLKAGVNLANMKSSIYENTTNRTSFHAGVLAHIHVSNHFAVQPEIVYSSQGFNQQVTSNLDMEVNADYINVPVMFQYMYRGARFQTGPQLGFLLNADAKLSDNTETNLDEYLKKVDFGWSFGLGYLTTSGFGIDARYNLGISNINDKITAAGVTDNEINNRVWQFGIFYQFMR